MRNVILQVRFSGRQAAVQATLFVLLLLFVSSAAVRASDSAAVTRVACVGDSITYGAGVADREKNSYPAQLGRLLGANWEVRNFGVSGTTLLKRGDKPYWKEAAFKAAKDFAPNIVVIMLGTNDTKPFNWQFADLFTSDYRSLIAQFAAMPSKPRIYICRPVPVPKTGNYGINEAGIEQEIPLIDAVALETHSAVIDLYGALSGHDDLLPDNVHPNAAGATLMARKVYEALHRSAAH